MKIKFLNKLPKGYLNKKLRSGLKNKYVGAEQMFRNPNAWYELTSYTNPYITIYSELKVLAKHEKEIHKFIHNSDLIFYGLGTGDTEIEVIKTALQHDKKINIIGVDVQQKFINGFVQSLKNLSLYNTNYRVNFYGINGLFQDIKNEDLKIPKAKAKRAHTMLGNTMGNFEAEEIFPTLARLINRGDILLIGFQTDNNLVGKFNQYAKNRMFNNFIKKNLPNIKTLQWKLNKKASQVEAWSKGALVFHSKKINPQKMIKQAKQFGFKNMYNVGDENSCIQIFKKV